MHLPGSALEGGAVFEGEGQAAIRIGRGVVQQAAPELFAESGDRAILLFQNPEEVLHCAAPVPDVADLLCDRILLGLGLFELLAECIETLVVFGLVLCDRTQGEFNSMIEDLTTCGLISVRVEDNITYYDSTSRSDLYEGKKFSAIKKFVLDALEAVSKGIAEGSLNAQRDPQYAVLV